MMAASNEIRIAAFMALICSLACQLTFATEPSGAPVARTNDSFPVLIQVDAAQPKAELQPIWRFFALTSRITRR